MVSLSQATSYHLGRLKAQLAKLRTQLLEPAPGTVSKAGDGFEVQKFGNARVALIGFPSVGKSTLLTHLSGTKSEAASYEFTTLTVRVPSPTKVITFSRRRRAPRRSAYRASYTTATRRSSCWICPVSSWARRKAAAAGAR